MEYRIEVQRVPSQKTAVVRCRAKLNELTTVVPKGCREVWSYFRSAGLPKPGRGLALYHDDEIDLECGVEVAEAFTGSQRVVNSCTPAGLVGTTTHVGPYQQLHEAHQAIRQWCLQNGYMPAGPKWEIYGHWSDAPGQLRTDVYYFLRDV
jgi:effector-binding domain-containing protein